MANKNRIPLIFVMTILIIALVANGLPQAEAAPKVNITFTASGYSSYSGEVLTVDGTTYYTWNLPVTLNLKPDSTFAVTAVSSITGWDSNVYTFSSWTNGNGLVTNTGTFTVPSSAMTVSANYAKSTINVKFRTLGLSNLNSGTAQNTVLTIDGTEYDYWDVANTNFLWLAGSTHTVTAISSITGWDNIKHDFSSWTNGNGLTTNTGTFTTPTSDVTVTANYEVSATTSYTAHFSTSGLSNVDGAVLEIDGTNYTYSSLPTTSFTWAAGSTHIVRALQPVYSYDTPAKGFNFSSWTNGNGLTAVSGTFTMPTSDVTVTANYVQSTVHVTFRTAGLSNLNLDTVLTIDGTEYDYWDVAGTNMQWMIGSTHTITATSSITGWDGITHYFSSWTNGNGLTTASGTFTTPNGDVEVTVNYVATATTLTINCVNSTVDKGNTVTISGTLTSGSTALSGKTVTLTYNNGTAWYAIGDATTTTDGTYSYIWLVPADLENGVYPLMASFAGDSSYQACSANTGSSGNGVHLQVLPESWGSIVALVACFGGALVYFKVRKPKQKLKTN